MYSSLGNMIIKTMRMCFQLDGISVAELKQNHGPESDGGVWVGEEGLFQTRWPGQASLGVISH